MSENSSVINNRGEPIGDGVNVSSSHVKAPGPILRPNSEKCFSRVVSLSKVDGIEPDEVELLNEWYLKNWRVVQASLFSMNTEFVDKLRNTFESSPTLRISPEKIESYLSAQHLLYYGLRLELKDVDEDECVSKKKKFQQYYYTARENPIALNSAIVLSNLLWSCSRYVKDEFALSCLLGIMLQAYPAALEVFIKLGGVECLKVTLDYLAVNKRLKESTNYLLKCLTLLNKLDISFKILQTSKIGIPINGIATSAKNLKQGIDYDCGSDQVKLKAADLIKKWKAIRDASLPTRVPESVVKREAKIRKVQSVGRQNDTNGRSVANAKNEETPSGVGGSFVLNILDTMMEQREKEKKRKQAIRNAQKMGAFHSVKTNTAKESAPPKEEVTNTVRSPCEPSQPIQNPTSMSSAELNNVVQETNVEMSGDEMDVDVSEPKRTPEGNSEIESLVNFFRNYNSSQRKEEQSMPTAKKNRTQFSDCPAIPQACPGPQSTPLVSTLSGVPFNIPNIGSNLHSSNFTQHVGSIVDPKFHENSDSINSVHNEFGGGDVNIPKGDFVGDTVVHRQSPPWK